MATRARPAGSTAFRRASSASRPGRRGSRIVTACVGVGRDDWPDTGSGAELYVVIGQAPRQLDRNIVTVGRVLRGMELLSSLPRGTGAMGLDL